MTNAVGVDVGGTGIKAVLLDPNDAVLGEVNAATPLPDPTGERTADVIAACVRELAGEQPVSVGVTSPGFLDEPNGVVLDAVNLAWRDVPIRRLVEERLSIPAGFGHDVRAGGLAEMRSRGPVADDSVTAFVAVGTGLAAAIYIGQRPLVGHGWAGEIGQIVFPAGPHAGKRIEQVASAAVLAERAGTKGAAEVVELIAGGDARAAELWDDTAAALAFGLAAMIATVAPDVVIMGGGLAEAGETLFSPTRDWLKKWLPDVPLPELQRARHGKLAGAIGAAYLGRDRIGAWQ